MKISKVEPQKKNKNRCSIYIDGEFRFGLSKELALKYDLKAGDEISETEINDILLQEEKDKIRSRALKILHYRQRSVKELRSRLINIGFDPPLVEEIVNEFIADKTLNDERFAKAFTSDYTTLNPKGNRFISRELLKRGIPKEMVANLTSKRNERGMIKKFMQKKLNHLDKSNPKERQKIIRRLLYHGFTPSTIYDVINEYT